MTQKILTKENSRYSICLEETALRSGQNGPPMADCNNPKVRAVLVQKIMHPLQKHILHQLMFNKDLNFSKLKPKNIESNLFVYHLKLIINDGLVYKNPTGRYELTIDGKTFSDKISLAAFKPRIQPKIITMIVCKRKDGKQALYKKRRHPFIGLVGFPYGKIHLGEKVLAAANRELLEKANLEASLTLKGNVYMTTYQQEELFNQTFCHVFSAIKPQGELLKDSDIGDCFWGDVRKIDPKELIPGALDIYHLVEKKPGTQLFFAEFVYQI